MVHASWRIAQDPLDLTAHVDHRRRAFSRARELLVHDRRRPLDDHPEPLLGLAKLLLGLLAIRDVHHHALPVEGPAVLVADQLGFVMEPDDPTVGRDHPVVLTVGLARVARRAALGLDPRPVLGVDPLDPEPGFVPPCRGEPGDGLDLGTDVCGQGRQVVGPRREVGLLIRDGRCPLDDQAEPLLGLTQLFLGLLALGDVEDEALPVRRGAVLAADQHRLFVHPHDPAVGGDQAVVVREGLAGLLARRLHRLDHLAVVRMRDLTPEPDVAVPAVDGVAQDALDQRAHERRGLGHVRTGHDGLEVGHGRQAFDEIAVPLLGRALALLGELALGDVDREAQEVFEGPVRGEDGDR